MFRIDPNPIDVPHFQIEVLKDEISNVEHIANIRIQDDSVYFTNTYAEFYLWVNEIPYLINIYSSYTYIVRMGGGYPSERLSDKFSDPTFLSDENVMRNVLEYTLTKEGLGLEYTTLVKL